MRVCVRVPSRSVSVWYETISPPERCVPLWSPDRIWSPRRNPIGHGTCPMYPMGVNPTLRVGYTPNARLCPKPCSHYVFTPTPLWTRMSPESQRPPEDSRPMGTWQMHPHLVHEGVVPPAHLAGRRLDLQRSSGTRVLVDPRVEVVAVALRSLFMLTKRSYHLLPLRVSGRPGAVPAWGRLTLSLTEEQIAQVDAVALQSITPTRHGSHPVSICMQLSCPSDASSSHSTSTQSSRSDVG